MPKRTYARRKPPAKRAKVTMSASKAATVIQRAWRKRKAAKRRYNSGRLITAGGSLRTSATANLVYEWYDEMTAGAPSGLTWESFNVTGLYDPEHELGGGQSRLFDQMMGLYNRYRVLSAYLTVEVFNSKWSVVGEPLLVGLYQTDDGNAPEVSGASDLSVTRNILTAKSHNGVLRSGTTVGTDQTGGKRIYLRQRITNPYILNGGHENRDKEGTKTANPSVSGYSVLVAHADGQTGNSTIKFRARLSTRVLFTDPIAVADA